MLLATIILLGAIPQSGEMARAVANAPVAAVSAAPAAAATEVNGKDSGPTRELPSMPQPKVDVNAAVQPPQPALPIQPMKTAYNRPRETHGQRVAWYTLMVAGHGAAAFDAYSTRQALSGNYGVETNPLLRPFAHSSALYAATQASPALMDFLGKRMMVSDNRLVRKLWWVPQVAGGGFSVAAGVHNLSVVR